MSPIAGVSAEGAARARVAKRAVKRVVGFILDVGLGGWLGGWVLVLGWMRMVVRRELVFGEGGELALCLDVWLRSLPEERGIEYPQTFLSVSVLRKCLSMTFRLGCGVAESGEDTRRRLRSHPLN